MANKRNRRGPRVGSPKSVERALGAEYARAISKAEAQILSKLAEEMPRLYRAAGIRAGASAHLDSSSLARMDVSTSHNDGWSDDIRTLMVILRGYMGTALGRAFVESIARKAAKTTSIITGRQTAKQIETLYGIDVFREPSTTSDIIDAFIQDNVNLIKSIESDLLTQVEQTVSNSIRSGVRNEELSKDLKARFGVSKSRARLIARDQTNKLSGQLTRARHESLGIEEYIWRTVSDERVRSSHAARDGKKFRYDEPPADGNPGQPIQCRCYADPVIPDLE